jgi:hypothetical protein
MSFGYENGNEMGDDTPAYMYWRLVLISISIPSGDWVRSFVSLVRRKAMFRPILTF